MRARVPLVGAAVVLLATGLIGSWHASGQWLAWRAELLAPSALGAPIGAPPLRLMPLGGTTVASWLVEVVAALVLIGAVWWRLREATGHPFVAGLWATILGTVAANVLRVVYGTFASHADVWATLVLSALTIVGSVVTGALLGLVVGLAAQVVARRERLPQEVTA